jgi:hypothetical protein
MASEETGCRELSYQFVHEHLLEIGEEFMYGRNLVRTSIVKRDSISDDRETWDMTNHISHFRSLQHSNPLLLEYHVGPSR